MERRETGMITVYSFAFFLTRIFLFLLSSSFALVMLVHDAFISMRRLKWKINMPFPIH